MADPPAKRARVDAGHHDTSVYVSGLPTHIGQMQMGDIVKKYGRVKKIKIYKDEFGSPKGACARVQIDSAVALTRCVCVQRRRRAGDLQVQPKEGRCRARRHELAGEDH